jgi:hypothetical protein
MLIGDKYKIESGELNITLFKKYNNKKTKKEAWRLIGYFTDIKQALWFMVKHDIQGMGFDNLVKIDQRLDEIHATIKALIPS